MRKMIDRNLIDLTDADILSSLKVIATTRNCNECKIRNCKWGTCNCEQITANAALELINRQKSEIERLQKEVNLVSIQFQDLQERVDEIKVDAYKEFAKRLESYLLFNKKCEMSVISFENISNFLKVLVGKE